tara:strand:+ start:62 stop:958 length:897 start_codon:yes stop_codon:yes gene_type:complete
MIKQFKCDVCDADDPVEIKCLRTYTNNQKIYVCKNCGFVYVRERRTSSEVAEVWSEEIFKNQSSKNYYSARIPAVKARQTFVADLIDSEIGLKNKNLCDIGTGEGEFLKIIRNDYKAEVFGIEPSKYLCEELKKENIKNFCGKIEDIEKISDFKKSFDIVTIMWTLENSSEPNTMLKISRNLLKDNGYLVVSTGSRILVPFKKPLNYYIDDSVVDTHPTRYSKNTLSLILKKNGFKVFFINRYIDQDWLCIIAKKEKENNKIPGDDYKEVIDFFERWNKETKNHYLKKSTSKKLKKKE